MKSEQKDLNEKMDSLETQVYEREKEIDRLKHGLHAQPGGKMLNSNNPNSEHSLQMSLKASQLQLNILQKRNQDLETKLQQSLRK